MVGHASRMGNMLRYQRWVMENETRGGIKRKEENDMEDGGELTPRQVTPPLQGRRW